MENKPAVQITVEVLVDAPVKTVWEKWTNPDDIMKWNFASDDWHTTKVENNLRPGERFLSRMEAKDGSIGFDFWGIYDNIITNQLIESTLGDGRRLRVAFHVQGEQTKVEETFDAETENSLELQRTGWQAILENFKKHVESGMRK